MKKRSQSVNVKHRKISFGDFQTETIGISVKKILIEVPLKVLRNPTAFLAAFESKVIMYLFEDAAKCNPGSIFKGEKNQLTYSSICKRLNTDFAQGGGLRAILNINITPIEDTTIATGTAPTNGATEDATGTVPTNEATGETTGGTAQ